MPYNVPDLVLVLLEELPCARKCYLVDVLVHFLCSHTQTVVYYLKGLRILIEDNTYIQLTELTFELA